RSKRVGLVEILIRAVALEFLSGDFRAVDEQIKDPAGVTSPISDLQLLGLAREHFQIPGKPAAVGGVPEATMAEVAGTGLFTTLIVVTLILLIARADAIDGAFLERFGLSQFSFDLGLFCLPLSGRKGIPVNHIRSLAMHLIERLERDRGGGLVW